MTEMQQQGAGYEKVFRHNLGSTRSHWRIPRQELSKPQLVLKCTRSTVCARMSTVDIASIYWHWIRTVDTLASVI